MIEHEKYLLQPVRRPECVMSHGNGSWLYDEAGREHLDFVQGWAVNSLGHAPPEIGEALSEQARKLLTPSPAFHNRPMLELCRELVNATGLARAFLTNSGAEANDAALKLARKWGRTRRAGAFRIVTTENAFHGRTLATMAASGKPGWDVIAPPNLPGFVRVPYDDVAAVARAIDESTCAVMLEPIQGEAGVVVPRPGYLRQLRELTRERGVLLILDEVQTGCGRTGTFSRAEAEDITPDVLTLGKGLGAGVPLAAVIASESAACFEAGDHGGTYVGNPLMAACGLAVVRCVRAPGFLESVRRRGQHLEASLRRLAERSTGPRLVEVRGAGLLWAVRFDVPCAAEVQRRCFELGLLLNAPRPDTLRLMPQLRVSDAEVDEMIRRLSQALMPERASQREAGLNSTE